MVTLNTWYLSPAGIRCTPIGRENANLGWIVQFVGGNFAFVKFVTDADFAAYTLEEK